MPRTSKDILAEIEDLDAGPRQVRTRRLALMGERERVKGHLTYSLTSISQDDCEHVGNMVGPMWNLVVETDQIRILNSTERAIALLEESEEYHTVLTVLDPLFLELEEAHATEAAQLAAIGEAEREVHEARTAAEAKAAAVVGKDKALQDAAAKLAALKQSAAHLIPEKATAPLDINIVYHEGETAARELQADFK